MKKIAFYLLLALLSITLIVITALVEDFFRGAGMVVGVLMFFAAFAIIDSSQFREQLGCYFLISGPVLAVSAFLLFFFLKVHVYSTDNSVVVRSRFCTRILATGTRMDTKTLGYAFTTEYGFIDGIDSDEFYFVHTDHGTCIVCDRFAKQIELKAPVTIVKQDFKDGTLEFVRDGHGNIYDLHGRLFKDKESYVPIKNDYTIDDSPLN